MVLEHREALDTSGYCVLENFMTGDFLSRIRDRVDRLFEQEGENAGSEFRLEAEARRLANLVDKGEVFEQAAGVPLILEYVGHVLGPNFKLSSLNVRSANPHSTSAQPLHTDMGALPDQQGYWVCNTVWMLDDFTTANGAIRVVPGSHRWARRPQDVFDNPRDPHSDEILITGKAGTVIVMNAHAWHGGTANSTAGHRRAMHGFYCRRDKPQQQYQKRLLRPEVQNRLSPDLRHLLALDDPLNDELSATDTNRSGFLK